MAIETAGFSAFEAGRSSLEEEILSIASRWNVKVVGPNCVGMVNMENGLALPFFPLDYKHVKRGGVSFISQSGELLISRSGGGQPVPLSDAASRHGFSLAKLSSSVFKALDQRVRGGVIRRRK